MRSSREIGVAGDSGAFASSDAPDHGPRGSRPATTSNTPLDDRERGGAVIIDVSEGRGRREAS